MRMIPRQSLTLAVTTIAMLVVCGGPAFASSSKKQVRKIDPREVVYRCKDARGQSYFGQNIPPECMEADIEVMDATGRVVRVIPGRRSLEAVAAQKSIEEGHKADAQRDRTLIATYLSVADIERLRDQRLDLLVQQAHVTEQYIVNLKEREARLVEDVQRYRPYSASPKAPVLPDHVAEDIVNTVNGLQIYVQELAKNTEEQQRLRSAFGSDIERFKELKGLK